MSWTEQQIQMLKEMWGHGFSASEIAGRIGGGLSRNAIIGKAHRLKLSSRPSPISREDGEEGAMQVMTGALKSSRKRVMLRPLPVVPTAPSTTVKALNNKGTGFSSFDNIKRTEGVAVTKAGDRHCRWPVGDPRSPDFRFCGCMAYEGLPYCIDHARVAYQNVGKKHRASESEGASAAPVASSEFRLPGHTRYS
jgi:GcrA cell cycle regulator